MYLLPVAGSFYISKMLPTSICWSFLIYILYWNNSRFQNKSSDDFCCVQDMIVLNVCDNVFISCIKLKGSVKGQTMCCLSCVSHTTGIVDHKKCKHQFANSYRIDWFDCVNIFKSVATPNINFTLQKSKHYREQVLRSAYIYITPSK